MRFRLRPLSSPRPGPHPAQLLTRLLAAIVLASTLVGCGLGAKLAKLAFMGRARELRKDEATGAEASARPTFLVLGIDGMKRDVLYDLLATGQVPGLAGLLGGAEGGRLPHAYLDRTMTAPFPSVTIVGWASIFTGAPPAVNGVTGNEFFLREELRMAAPIPCSFDAREPRLATYTDGYANALLKVPTLYEHLREREPDLASWVSVSQFYRGADRLLIAPRSAVIDMLYGRVRDFADGKAYAVFEQRDRKILDAVIREVADDDRPVPDVLTVYVSGTDGYAHMAPEGPDAALREMMTGEIDRGLDELRQTLARRNALANRYVIVVSDHGHSPVPHDGSTMLSADEKTGPPAVLTGAGFRLRPLALDVAAKDFQAVLAYENPVAYVYVADRSTCRAPGTPCDWTRAPRFRADVLRAAEAFFQANRSGRYVPAMRHTLDMVLARRPRPLAEDDGPFEVYVGGGRLVPVGAYLRRHPHPTWVDFEARLRELAVGPHGERAGDVVLVARTGTDESAEGRYYFSNAHQESTHGSASRADSEVAFVVAHPARTSAELAATVRAMVGEHPRSRAVTDLVLRLRAGR